MRSSLTAAPRLSPSSEKHEQQRQGENLAKQSMATEVSNQSRIAREMDEMKPIPKRGS